MHLMGSDLNNILKQQALSDEHVQFLVYQIIRGLKVCLLLWDIYLHIYGFVLPNISSYSMFIQLELFIE